jgi:hypothetical protein
MKPNIYVYKCVWDDGVAPCVDHDVLSLTICKPKIRTSAKIGDYIVAFGRNSESPRNRLVYAAKITDVVSSGDYFHLAKYRRRQDSIYERTPKGGLRLINDAVHNNQNLSRDIGSPPIYRNAIALISNDFRYFGGQGTDEWKEHAPYLTKKVEQLMQGHRVNHSREVRDDLLKLIARIWKKYHRRINGKPRHAETEASNCVSKCKPKKKPSRCKPKKPNIC